MSSTPRTGTRPASLAFAVFAALVVAFTVWCVLLMVSTRGLRRDLEDRIGWLRELDAIGLAEGEAEAAGRHQALRTRMLAQAPTPALRAAIDAVDLALTQTTGPGLAQAVDALRQEIRRENAAISSELGGAWTGLNLAALAALVLAAGSLVLLRITLARTRETRRLGQQLAASESRIRAVVELAADAIVTVDSSGAIAGVNRAAGELFGLGVDELIGRPLGEWVPGIGPLLREPPAVPTRLAARRREESFPAAVSVARLEEGPDAGVVVVLRDATLDVRTEEAMRAARDAALRAAEARSEFVASMSHELRTPLNTIIGYGEMLREELEEQGKSELVADLDRMLGSSRHLVELIGGILDMSKIEAGMLDLSLAPIDVEDVVTEVAASAELLASRQGNRFSLDLGPDLRSIVADRTRLRQILLNLLSNAAKFTERGTIRMTVRRERREGEAWLVFMVEDTGVGISPEALGRLFQAFERGDHRTRRRHDGTGLGLKISQRLCEHMGGSIAVTSEVGRGSTFTVTLPARMQMKTGE